MAEFETIEATPGCERRRPLFLIYSKLTLLSLYEILEEFTDEIGMMTIMHDREGKETNRTVVVLRPKVYDEIVAQGKNKRPYDLDFTIVPYEIRKHNLPNEHQKPVLFIPFPKKIKLSEVTIHNIIAEKLKSLVSFGVIPDKSWRINAPGKRSDFGGQSKSFCFVTFNREVSKEQIAIVKVVLDGSEITDESNEKFRCFWARNHKRKDEAEEGKEGEEGVKEGENWKKVKTSKEKKRERKKRKREQRRKVRDELEGQETNRALNHSESHPTSQEACQAMCYSEDHSETHLEDHLTCEGDVCMME
jgi:hypothetical protein